MSARSETLTARQQEILDFIRATVESEGRPPTRAEVCTAFGFRSPNAAGTHPRALAAQGADGFDVLGGVRQGDAVQGSQGRFAPVQCVAHAADQHAVLDGVQAFGTFRMARAHLVLAAIRVGEIPGLVCSHLKSQPIFG